MIRVRCLRHQRRGEEGSDLIQHPPGEGSSKEGSGMKGCCVDVEEEIKGKGKERSRGLCREIEEPKARERQSPETKEGERSEEDAAKERGEGEGSQKKREGERRKRKEYSTRSSRVVPNPTTIMA